MPKKAVKLIGDWDHVTDVLHNLNSAIKKAGLKASIDAALFAEGAAKKHISRQDLGWYPLKPSTIAAKIRKGQSTNILVATSTMFQAITSFNNGRTAYVGVKRTAKTRDGDDLHNIARALEYGSKNGNMKARPLWRPVRKETKIFLKDGKIVQKELRRLLKI